MPEPWVPINLVAVTVNGQPEEMCGSLGPCVHTVLGRIRVGCVRPVPGARAVIESAGFEFHVSQPTDELVAAIEQVRSERQAAGQGVEPPVEIGPF